MSCRGMRDHHPWTVQSVRMSCYIETDKNNVVFKARMHACCLQKNLKKNVKNVDVGKRKQSAATVKSASVQPIQKLESDVEDASEAADEIKFTLKQLIRKLHIVEPVQNVMCLIGKRSVLTYVL